MQFIIFCRTAPSFKSLITTTPIAYCYPCAKRDLAHYFTFTCVPRQCFASLPALLGFKIPAQIKRPYPKIRSFLVRETGRGLLRNPHCLTTHRFAFGTRLRNRRRQNAPPERFASPPALLGFKYRFIKQKRGYPIESYSKGQFFCRIWHSPHGLCLFPLFKRILAVYHAFLPLPKLVLLR